MSKPRHLHPAAVIILVIHTYKEFFKVIIAPLVIWVFSHFSKQDAEPHTLFYAIAFVVLVIVGVLWGILAWRRFTYVIVDGELRVNSGVVIRKKHFIPRERIQSIDMEEDLLHRIFGIVKVRVVTAGTSHDEISLAAVTRSEARDLREALTAVARIGGIAEDNGDVNGYAAPVDKGARYRLGIRDLLLAGATSGNISMIASLVGLLASFGQDLIPWDKWFHELAAAGGRNTISLAGMITVLVCVAAWLLSMIGTVVTYGQFRLNVTAEDIQVSHGLIARRRVAIPKSRIQAVRVVEGIIRQPFGFVSVYVDIAGFGKQEREHKAGMLMPFLRRKDLPQFLQQIVPEFAADLRGVHRLPTRALRGYMIKSSILPGLVVCAASIFFYPWGLLSALLLLVSVSYGWMRYRDAGWRIADGRMIVRWRRGGRCTAIVVRHRTQAFQVAESPFQRRIRLTTVRWRVASGHAGTVYSIIGVDEQTADECLLWLERGVQ